MKHHLKKTEKPDTHMFDGLQTEQPKFAVPFRVLVDGRRYEGIEISLTEITALGLAGRQAAGPLAAVIEFPFVGFSVDVAAEISLVEASTDTGIMRFLFKDALGDHRIPLQSIFNSYIAGELTNVPGLLGGKAAKKQVAEPGAGSPVARRASLSRGLKGIFFGAVGLGLAVFVVERVHERIFVYQPTTVSRIAAETIQLAARKTGNVVVLNETAAVGQPLFGILGDDNLIATAKLPCDCIIAKKYVLKGGVAIEGQPVLALLPSNSDIYVTTEINPDMLVDLNSGAVASVTFADGTTTAAKLRSVPSQSADGQQSEAGLLVTLQTEKALSLGQLGEAVSVKIDSFPAWLGKSFRSATAMWRS